MGDRSNIDKETLDNYRSSLLLKAYGQYEPHINMANKNSSNDSRHTSAKMEETSANDNKRRTRKIKQLFEHLCYPLFNNKAKLCYPLSNSKPKLCYPLSNNKPLYSDTWLKRTTSKADTLLRRTKNLGPFGQVF